MCSAIPTPPATRGRPKDLEKRDAIFTAARRLFREQGYSSTSMQEIADAACVSKLTLYSHFQDKEDLFRHTIEAFGRELSHDEDLCHIVSNNSAHDALLYVARFIMQTLTDPDSIASQRMILSEAKHFSHVSRAYIQAGLGGFLTRLEQFLRAIGQHHPAYVFPNPYKAACHFYGLVKSHIHPRFLYDVDTPSETEVDQHLNDIVSFFLQAHHIRNP